ncbi:hypothetical protein BsWGS_28982 [Bradybaena similaris]
MEGTQEPKAGCVSEPGLDILDTLTLARLDRENQGYWEAEYSYGGEADLHRHYYGCMKNPGHKNFIAVDKFSIEDLPDGYRDKDVVEYIRAMSDLTVRVTVRYVSSSRPQTGGLSGKPYPGYPHRGQRKTTVGTGWVDRVDMGYSSGNEFCQCKDCLISSTRQTEFARINICTATHVVYDDSEAEHTTCHLFFDRGGTPETCQGVVTLTRMYCDYCDPEADHIEMFQYTHDLGLAQWLNQRCQQRSDLRRIICTKPLQTWKISQKETTPDKQPLLFIVSHPHGCSKQISIGRWTSACMIPNEQYSFTYTTATCPGSSGALVCLPPKFLSPAKDEELLHYRPVHHGVYDKQPGINLALTESIRVMDDLVSLDILKMGGGSWEDKLCCAEENDLRRHFDNCQRNPGHPNFFPVDKFSMLNLPPDYRKEEILEFIKSVSDLTVRVSVSYVSEERPETVQGTDIPYPWYSIRGSNRLRVGSGQISEVEFPDHDVCEGEKCKNFDTPNKGWFARIHIQTAAHVVYNDQEGKHTTCHLFFNSDETPDACKDVVTLATGCRTDADIENDMCELIYFTHDKTLASRLQTLIERRQDLVRRCYHFYREEKNSRLGPPLNIVVSHPHGCAKQISLGQYGSHGNTGSAEQCPYSSITCPGSSGAVVLALGWLFLYPCFE